MKKIGDSELFQLKHFLIFVNDFLLLLISNCYQLIECFSSVFCLMINCSAKKSCSYVKLVILKDFDHTIEFDGHFHYPVWLIARSFYYIEFRCLCFYLPNKLIKIYLLIVYWHHHVLLQAVALDLLAIYLLLICHLRYLVLIYYLRVLKYMQIYWPN